MATKHVGQRLFGLAGLLLGGVWAPAPASAQELGERAQQQLRAIYADKAAWTPAQRKLATSLLYASRESQGQAMVQGLDQGLALLRRVADRAGVEGDGTVVVDIRAEVTDELLQLIGAVGGRVAAAHPELGALRARLPIRRVEEIAARPEVRQIGPRQEFLLNTGAQTSQGDAAHAAASARTTLGANGTGMKVGVLSDGVDSLGARQGTGDLPVTCAPTPGAGACVTVVPGQQGSGDEGTAMLEIVHDLAPGAKLYFATAVNGDASFAANILALRNTYGCDIIVDDVTYLNEGAFQDGVIARAVNQVKASGALFFSSAGNSGRLNAGTSGTWEGDFLNSGSTLTINFPTGTYGPVPMHSFNGLTGGSAATSDPLTASSGIITLKWSDPLGASTNDYDLILTDSGFTTVLDLSTDTQNGTQDPLEGLNPGAAGSRVVVTLWSGGARALRVDTNRGRLSIATDGAVVGHNGGDGTISVAAANVSSAGGGAFTGGAANPVASYSSDGPRRMFFNPDGSAITAGNVLFATSGGRDLQEAGHHGGRLRDDDDAGVHPVLRDLGRGPPRRGDRGGAEVHGQQPVGRTGLGRDVRDRSGRQPGRPGPRRGRGHRDGEPRGNRAHHRSRRELLHRQPLPRLRHETGRDRDDRRPSHVRRELRLHDGGRLVRRALGREGSLAQRHRDRSVRAG